LIRKRPKSQTSRIKRSKMQMQYSNINSIRPYPNNPRDNDQAVDFLVNSIKSYGFLVPIIVDKEGVIVAGHTRYKAAKKAGLMEVPTISAIHLTPEQIKQFRLIDNKVAEMSMWDFDLLAPEISALKESGLDFTNYGWSTEEIDCLTDMVADDCLSSGVTADLNATERERRAERRSPSQTRFVCGEFTFFIPTEIHKRWANEIKVNAEYNETEIIKVLKEALGIVPYENGH